MKPKYCCPRLLAPVVLIGISCQVHGAFTPVETFDARTNGNIGGQNGWVVTAGDATTCTVIVDPTLSTNKVLFHSGANDAGIPIPNIAQGNTGTFFYRVKRIAAAGNDVSIGLTDVAIAAGGLNGFGNFEVQPNLVGVALRGRDLGATPNVVTNTLNGAWYKVWLVVDNSADTYKMYVQSDQDAAFSTRTEYFPPDGVWNYRNAPATNPLVGFQLTSNNSATQYYLDDVYIDAAGTTLSDPTDTDADGLNDTWEMQYFASLSAPNGGPDDDFDSDQIPNRQEYLLGTNPAANADFDGDGLTDGVEYSGSANTGFSNTPTSPTDSDSDDDGLNDGAEVNRLVGGNPAPTNPNDSDTDDDGFYDDEEILGHATDPNDPDSVPKVFEMINLTKLNGGFEFINNGVVNTAKIAAGWDVPGNDVDGWRNWTEQGTTFTDSGVEAGGTSGLRGFVQNGSATYNLTNYTAKAGDVIRVTYNRMNGGTLAAYLVIDATDLSLGILQIPTSTIQTSATGTSNRLTFTIPAGNLAVGRKIGVGFRNTAANWPGVDNVILSVKDTDSDNDGLSDFAEDFYFGNNDQNPTPAELAIATGNGNGGGSPDVDGDGSSNVDELAAGSNPNNPASTVADVDADGLVDAWEVSYFGNIATQNGNGDPDGDFNNNEAEETADTSPMDAGNWPDSEPDTLNDGWEKLHFSGSLAQVATGDPDGDGFNNLAEMTAGSHPNDISWSPSVPKLVHRWSFNGSLNDSVGTSHATIQNDTPANLGLSNTLTATELTLAGGARATTDWAKLGANLLSGKKTPVTVELWATHNAVQNWARIFDFHSSTTENLFMSWTQGTTATQDRAQWVDAVATPAVDNTNAPYVLGTKYHILMTITPAVNTEGETRILTGARVSWYTKSAVAGSLVGPAKGSYITTNTLIDLNDVINALGHSPWAGDNNASASYDEVRLWDGILPASARQTLHAAGPENPSLLDGDGDGLYDSWEIAFFTNTTSQTGTGNPDGDAANNAAEQEAGSNPIVASSIPGDVDGDTLADDWELTNFGNLEQIASGDPDGDFDTNGVEETNLTTPTSRTSYFTSTADTVSDSWKLFYGITAASGLDDSDGDTVDNQTEFLNGTNPIDTDTDDDLLLDGEEVTAGTNPLDVDSDNDELNDGPEVKTHFTLPLTVDTDGDSFSDGYEVLKGSIPTNPTSFPTQPSGFTLVENFEGAGMTVGQTFNGVNGWTANPTKATVVADPANGGNKAGQWLDGAMSKSLQTAGLQVVQGNTGTLFFQLYCGAAGLDHSYGLSDVVTPVPFGDFEAQLATIGADLRVRNGGAVTDSTYDIATAQWMNVWMVVNNNADTVDVYVSSPLGQTGQIHLNTTPAAFRNGVATNALVSLLFGENSGEVQVLIDNIHIDPAAQNLANPMAAAGDGDAMDDAWEITHFGNTTQTGTGDFDHDGSDNLTEFRLGLIPNNGSSRFAVLTASHGTGTHTITWPSQTGTTFKIERSTSLAAASWTELQAAYAGTAGSTTYTDSSAPAGKAFYRVTLNP